MDLNIVLNNVTIISFIIHILEIVKLIVIQDNILMNKLEFAKIVKQYIMKDVLFVQS